MPDLITSIDFIEDLPLYQVEKPYLVLLSISKKLDEKKVKTDNLEFRKHRNITIHDIGQLEGAPTLATAGFQIIQHKTDFLSIGSREDVRSYKLETEAFLKRELGADEVYCWEAKLRRNVEKPDDVLDLNDPLAFDRPAWAAHVDSTFTSGPNLIKDHLPDELKNKYLKPGYRFRIVNTWRSLLPIVEDNPLAVCDYRTVNKEDLLACDRVTPTKAGEVYYLKYNPEQKWYWLDGMTSKDVLLMIMYDSGSRKDAKFCPHAAVPNPNASPDAPSRYSIETRNIAISKC